MVSTAISSPSPWQQGRSAGVMVHVLFLASWLSLLRVASSFPGGYRYQYWYVQTMDSMPWSRGISSFRCLDEGQIIPKGAKILHSSVPNPEFPKSQTSSSHSSPQPRSMSLSAKRRQGRYGHHRRNAISKVDRPLESLNINLDSMAKSSQVGSAFRAHELLQRIEALHREGYYDMAPDIVSVNSVLNAWARSNDKSAPQQAMDLFLDEVENKGKQPDRITLNTLMFAHAKHCLSEQAESLLREMQPSYQISPDTISYNTVLFGYANTNNPEKAENLLREMVQISAGATAAQELIHEKEDSPSPPVVKPLVKPDDVSFNTVLAAWSRSKLPHAAKRAERLLQHMKQLYRAGNDCVEPDNYSYSCVLRAWANHGVHATSASKIRHLLEEMESLAKENPDLKPNAITYSTYMAALSKSGYRGAAFDANCILDRMLERFEQGDQSCRPDVVAFSTVIACWAREDSEESVDRALKVFEAMQEMSKLDGHSDLAPNSFTYTSLFSTLARHSNSGTADLAESMLQDMEVAFQAENGNAEPTVIHYNAVLDVHARGPEPDKAVRAKKLLDFMIALNRPGAVPNIITYNSLLRACANTFGSPEIRANALDVGTNALKQVLRNKLQPSSVTFVFFLKIVRKLTSRNDPKRLQMLKSSFEYCCRSGLVNDFILAQLKLACPTNKELFEVIQLHVGRGVAASDLPKSFTRNSERLNSAG